MKRVRAAAGEPAHILVSAPNRAGELFLSRLRQRGVPHMAIANNMYEKNRLESLGIRRVLVVDTRDRGSWTPPDIRIGKVFLFEDSMNLCCRYIHICKSWKTEAIHAVTRSDYSRAVYRSLGVKHLKYANKKDIPELANRLV
ncbi:hypothetical protein [Paenibacillus sp. GYB003]|uniref:hypothetical protein n=1 Tax=Paenibacillus sp. GYB003 TaxID=2994392 RepID=UPI002F967551